MDTLAHPWPSTLLVPNTTESEGIQTFSNSDCATLAREVVDLQCLSFKTALLLALTTANRVSELHALSVHLACMQFASDAYKVALKMNPAFDPKVRETSGTNKGVKLLAFFPLPFS